MPLPKTNLFKGDRVRLTRNYLTSLKFRNPHSPIGKLAPRVGTIVSDTLEPRFEVIVVHWDGCKFPILRSDRGYQPDDLELVED